jgi:hypothetical protein
VERRCDLVAGDLPRVSLVGVAAVSDGDDAHGAVVSEFGDDAVDADPVGPKPGEPSAQLVAEVRVAFELPEGVQDRVGPQVVEAVWRRQAARSLAECDE